MEKETKTCRNCKEEFTIDQEDFDFYEKMKVPVPTWCWKCQLMRRLAFRNERALYRRKESVEGKEVISIYSPDKPIQVYNQDYWESDNWDPLNFGREYDFSNSFFSQFHDLIKQIPWPSRFIYNSVNCDYCNVVTDNKNCYLVFGGDFNEDCAYSIFNFYSRDCFDVYWLNKSELSYECMDGENNYKVTFSQYVRDSADSSFLYNCSNLQNCLGCVNLKNKSYCIFNEQYTKEEYEKKLADFNLRNYKNLVDFKERFQEFKLKFPHRYAEILRALNSTGHNLHDVKNCKNCFDIYENAEDCKNIFLGGWGLKDSRNSNHVGHKAELIYDSIGSFGNTNRALFSIFNSTSYEIMYSSNCRSSSNLFGCVGLKNKQYCILNKQYTKEEYEELVPKIIKHMDEMPYIDKKGRTYKYGEFFPSELSFFAYNETVAQDLFPLTKEEAIQQGFKWKDPEERKIKPDIKTEDLPDDIKDVENDILEKTIQCAHAKIKEDGTLEQNCNEQCTTAFKIISRELDFYRKMNLPLPRLCPNCRNYQRIKKRNPLKLWKRKCMCNGKSSVNKVYQNTAEHSHGDEPCPNEFETSYSPDRKEIIYCEECYNKEIV